MPLRQWSCLPVGPWFCCVGSTCLQPAAQRLCEVPAGHLNANSPVMGTEPTLMEYELTSMPNCGCIHFTPNLPLSRIRPLLFLTHMSISTFPRIFLLLCLSIKPCSNLSSSNKLNSIVLFFYVSIFTVGKINNIKITTLTILGIQLCGMKDIHSASQPSLPWFILLSFL